MKTKEAAKKKKKKNQDFILLNLFSKSDCESLSIALNVACEILVKLCEI